MNRHAYAHTSFGYTKQVCSNCGKAGHYNRSCTQPILSYGVLALRKQTPSSSQSQTYLEQMSNQSYEILLIQRRNSIGFIELVRAKYKLEDLEYIRQQVAGTTAKEREMLLTLGFFDLWKELWGVDAENRHYRHDYLQAKSKFEQFVQGYEYQGTFITLKSILESVPVQWDTPEWGFPKGRRNVHETDKECALREFQEETGIDSSHLQLLENIEPFHQTFYGNNKIHYAHVFYIGFVPYDVKLSIEPKEKEMALEIGGIGWYSFSEAKTRIRATDREKLDILEKCEALLHAVSCHV